MLTASLQFRFPAIAFCALALASAASAATGTVLHSFIPNTGIAPTSGVISDGAGNLYGTASAGGSANAGVVYKLGSASNYTILYSFPGNPNGHTPHAGVVRDLSGNLYGTTEYGGPGLCGDVYKVDAGGNETILYTFMCGTDGTLPYAGLTLDAAGNLYGTTLYGGTAGGGVVFRINPAGQESVLYNFGGPDGYLPVGGVVLDAAGNLYGTTELGGSQNYGVVFKLDPSGQETLLYQFTGGPDGGYPAASLVRDAAGSLYGTAYEGGDYGRGVVFKLDPSGNETVLHSFGNLPADGSTPQSSLTSDSSGNIYGTTLRGGSFGFGTVFEIDVSAHREFVLYSFVGPQGEYAHGSVLLINGNLYGTTAGGGTNGDGVLYKITLAP